MTRTISHCIILFVIVGGCLLDDRGAGLNFPESDGDADGDGEGDSDGDGDGDGDADGDAGEDADAEVDVPDGCELISAGTFTMGSPEGELGRIDARETQHEVTLTRDFVIQSTEVTQSQFAALMGYNNSWFSGCDDCPVEMVNWHEAAAYCNALSATEGLSESDYCYECDDGIEEVVICTPSGAYASPYECPGYRLPTDAEWEYAARTGDERGTYNGDPDRGESSCVESTVLNPIAWYCFNADEPQSVAGLTANAWGLYDMLGNVWEWCHDWWQEDLGSDAVMDPAGPGAGSVRVSRGGSWDYDARNARAAFRSGDPPGGRFFHIGFRIVRSVP